MPRDVCTSHETSLAELSAPASHNLGEEDISPSTHDSELVDLLKCAFSHFRDQSSNRPHRSLTLDVKSQVDCAPASNRYATNWHAVWKCASDTARLVAQAARASMMRFERLDLYNTTDRCALCLPELRHVMAHFDTQAIKALALTISASDTNSNPGLSQCMVTMLGSALLLEQLELRWFNLRVFNAPATELVDRKFFDSIAPLSMPHLKSFSLRGVRTSEDALLTFLMAHSQLVDLTLEEIHLTQGRFLPIFTYIDNDMTALNSLYLNDLWESKLILFPGSKCNPHFRSLRSTAPSWLKRNKEGQLRKKIIHYREQTDRQLGSPAFTAWLRKRTLLYGPVEFNYI